MKKDRRFTIMMDKKLYEQLERYAEKNDEGLASVSARKAIRKFVRENK